MGAPDPDPPQAAVDAARRLRHEGWRLALLAVGLGVAQLWFLGWAETRLGRPTKLWIAGPSFLAYAALMMRLIWRYDRRKAAAGLASKDGASSHDRA